MKSRKFILKKGLSRKVLDIVFEDDIHSSHDLYEEALNILSEHYFENKKVIKFEKYESNEETSKKNKVNISNLLTPIKCRIYVFNEDKVFSKILLFQIGKEKPILTLKIPTPLLTEKRDDKGVECYEE